MANWVLGAAAVVLPVLLGVGLHGLHTELQEARAALATAATQSVHSSRGQGGDKELGRALAAALDKTWLHHPLVSRLRQEWRSCPRVPAPRDAAEFARVVSDARPVILRDAVGAGFRGAMSLSEGKLSKTFGHIPVSTMFGKEVPPRRGGLG